MQFDYEVSLADDTISIHYYDETFEEIPIYKYWQWVKDNERHEWTRNYYDPSKDDGHGQDTGYHDIDGYFDLPYKVIHDDLCDYLKQRKGQGKT